MSFSANVLKVMIASPGDLVEDRKIVTEEIYRWNDANATSRQLVLLPVKWETHSTPQFGESAQKILNRQILEDADIVIAIFATRIGTPTEEYVSGTVEEIKRHVRAGKTAKVYFSDIPVAPSTINQEQYASVQKFREECQSTGLYATFTSHEQFRHEFSQHLTLELNQPRFRWLEAPQPMSPSESGLSEDAIRLLRAAASSDDGLVGFQLTLTGSSIQTGQDDFGDGTPRSEAKWRAITQELESRGALESVNRNSYRVTDIGYRMVDRAESPADNTSPFQDHQTAHVRSLIEPLHYSERDLLRFLLVQGGSARGDVIGAAAVPKAAPGSFNMQSMCGRLLKSGVISWRDNRLGNL